MIVYDSSTIRLPATSLRHGQWIAARHVSVKVLSAYTDIDGTHVQTGLSNFDVTPDSTFHVHAETVCANLK